MARRRGVGIGINAAERARSAAADARRKKLAMAPAGVNANRWLANREGRTLSVDRLLGEVRAAIRALGGRPAQAAREHVVAYEQAVLAEIQPTLDYIASMQARRKAKRAQRRPRQRTEYEHWPTYWDWPEPGGYDHPAVKVDDLEGAALAAFNKFSLADADAVMPLQACFEEFEATWREEDPNAEDREMPLALARQAESACRVRAWYQHVLDAPLGSLPPGVYTPDWQAEIKAWDKAEDGGEGGAVDKMDAEDAAGLVDLDDIPF